MKIREMINEIEKASIYFKLIIEPQMLFGNMEKYSSGLEIDGPFATGHLSDLDSYLCDLATLIGKDFITKPASELGVKDKVIDCLNQIKTSEEKIEEWLENSERRNDINKINLIHNKISNAKLCASKIVHFAKKVGSL